MRDLESRWNDIGGCPRAWVYISSGRVDLPASCTDEPQDMVFLVRIADVSEFAGLIGQRVAFGAVREMDQPSR